LSIGPNFVKYFFPNGEISPNLVTLLMTICNLAHCFRYVGTSLLVNTGPPTNSVTRIVLEKFTKNQSN
jgi:hypothetical protein